MCARAPTGGGAELGDGGGRRPGWLRKIVLQCETSHRLAGRGTGAGEALVPVR